MVSRILETTEVKEESSLGRVSDRVSRDESVPVWITVSAILALVHRGGYLSWPSSLGMASRRVTHLELRYFKAPDHCTSS